MSILENEVVQRAAFLKGKLSRAAQQRLFVSGLVLLDAVIILLAFAFAYVIRFQFGLPFFRIEAVSLPEYYNTISLILTPIWLILFAVYRLYDYEILLGGLREYSNVFSATITGATLLAIAQFFSDGLVLARGWVGLAWVSTFVLISIGRLLARRVGYFLRSRGYLMEQTLIVGVNSEAEMLGHQLLEWPTSGLNLLGFLDDEMDQGKSIAKGLKVIGRIGDIGELVEKHQVSEIILVTSALPRNQVLEIFQRFGTSKNIRLRMSSGLFDLLNTGLSIKEMGYVPLIGVNRVRLSSVETMMKRAIDIAAGLAALVIGSPIYLALALAVRLDSKGPVIYRRRVMGLNGTQFDAFKFRTMHVNGDEILKAHPDLLQELEDTQKLKDDPRVTRVGAILRKFSLDELPQFVNILLGEMSLVGPRMISPPELKKYGQWGLNLLTVRPGLTGLWQVSGRSDVSYEDRVRLDMFYIRNYSIWLDIQLILQTIPAVLMKKGAY
jgi:exopolysaccharide biosynthesis polyprenyl glycosylphosphotransferase